MNRRCRIYAAAAVLALCASSQGQELMLEPVASGFDTATSVCAPPGDTQRLFVTTNGGVIHIIRDGVVLPLHQHLLQRPRAWAPPRVVLQRLGDHSMDKSNYWVYQLPIWNFPGQRKFHLLVKNGSIY